MKKDPKILLLYLSFLIKFSFVFGSATNADSLFNRGVYYWEKGKYSEAQSFFLKAMIEYRAKGDKNGIATCCVNIGTIVSFQGQDSIAILFFSKAKGFFEELGDKMGIASSVASLGMAYNSKGQYELALKEFQTALKIFEEIKDSKNISKVYLNIGNLISNQGNDLDGLKYLLNSLEIKEQTGDKEDLASQFISLGKIYSKLKKYNKAEEYLLKGMEESKRVDNILLIKTCYGFLFMLDSMQGNYKQAFEHHKLYFNYHDSILNENSVRNSIISRIEYNFQSKELLAKARQESKDLIEKKEREKNVVIRNSFAIGFLFMVFIALIIYKNFKRKHSDNLIISNQKKEILLSIEAATRIQTAILPSQKIMAQYLENSFILYKPKDIVAGDFYWMEIISLEENSILQLGYGTNQIILFAACDCTGHGVSGALVSVICHNSLNRAVREFGLTIPSHILDKTAELVIESFAKSEEDIKDGMDIALCAYHPQTKTLHYSGANNPLWLIQNGKLIETKADKQPIGMYEDNHPFTNHKFELNSGDTIYIFSDGYADQFSSNDKKLMKKNFKKEVLSIQHLSIPEQKDYLNNFIEKWKGGMEQTDDILVMGVKV